MDTIMRNSAGTEVSDGLLVVSMETTKLHCLRQSLEI